MALKDAGYEAKIVDNGEECAKIYLEKFQEFRLLKSKKTAVHPYDQPHTASSTPRNIFGAPVHEASELLLIVTYASLCANSHFPCSSKTAPICRLSHHS